MSKVILKSSGYINMMSVEICGGGKRVFWFIGFARFIRISDFGLIGFIFDF